MKHKYDDTVENNFTTFVTADVTSIWKCFGQNSLLMLAA